MKTTLLILLSIFNLSLILAQNNIPEPDFENKPYFYVEGESSLRSFDMTQADLDIKVLGMGYGGTEMYYSAYGKVSKISFPSNEIPRIFIKLNTAADPSTFVRLGKASFKKDRRRFKVASRSMGGKSRSTNEVYYELNFKRVDGNLFEILIAQELDAGEYAILPIVSNQGFMGSSGQTPIYCFGITTSNLSAAPAESKQDASIEKATESSQVEIKKEVVEQSTANEANKLMQEKLAKAEAEKAALQARLDQIERENTTTIEKIKDEPIVNETIEKEATTFNKPDEQKSDIDDSIQEEIERIKAQNAKLLSEQQVKEETPVPTNYNPPTKSNKILDVSVDYYKAKSLQKVEDLGSYIKIIGDKTTEWMEANKAIELATELFIDGSEVEVSSVNTPDKKRSSVPQYLNRLKLLKYDKVEVSWSKIQYVSDLRKGMDGNYYGVITFEQSFTGFIDNRVIYGDKTDKNIEIVLTTYGKSSGGIIEETWDVLLGNIGVVETRR